MMTPPASRPRRRPRLVQALACLHFAACAAPAGAQPIWSDLCSEALQSRAPLVQAGALLALPDRALGPPDEVLAAVLREKDSAVRRRMALVLGEPAVRRELAERARRRPEDIPRRVRELGSDDFRTRQAASAALRAVLWLAEPDLRRAAASS